MPASHSDLREALVVEPRRIALFPRLFACVCVYTCNVCGLCFNAERIFTIRIFTIIIILSASAL